MEDETHEEGRGSRVSLKYILHALEETSPKRLVNTSLTKDPSHRKLPRPPVQKFYRSDGKSRLFVFLPLGQKSFRGALLSFI